MCGRACHLPAMRGSVAGILHRRILGCGVEPWIVPILTTSVRAPRLFNDGTVDFCFIDGDHRFESVTTESSGLTCPRGGEYVVHGRAH